MAVLMLDTHTDDDDDDGERERGSSAPDIIDMVMVMDVPKFNGDIMMSDPAFRRVDQIGCLLSVESRSASRQDQETNFMLFL